MSEDPPPGASTKGGIDPGWRDADRSQDFDKLVEALDYFQTWQAVTRARRLIYRQLRPGPGRRIRDAGCGPGFDVAALAPRVAPDGIVAGLDSSEKVVGMARERLAGLTNVELQLGSVDDIPYPDDSFDASFALRTIQYLDEPLKAIRELMRVTRPGGRVVVCEGGMSMLDLPDTELTNRILGTGWSVRHGALGVKLKRLMAEAGLVRVTAQVAVGTDTQLSPYTLSLFRDSAAGAVDAGEVTADEAREWLAKVDSAVASGTWFGADCMVVASGTVAKRNVPS